MLSRRSIFGALPMIAIAATPVAVHAAMPSPAEAEAATFQAGLALVDPRLAPLAQQAISDGWKPSELFSILATAKARPSLMFARELSVEPSIKPGFEGFMQRTVQYSTYRDGLEPDHDTQVTAHRPD